MKQKSKAPGQPPADPQDGGVELYKTPLQIWHWRIRDGRGNVILEGKKPYFNRSDAENELSAIINYLLAYQAQEKKKAPYKRKSE